MPLLIKDPFTRRAVMDSPVPDLVDVLVHLRQGMSPIVVRCNSNRPVSDIRQAVLAHLLVIAHTIDMDVDTVSPEG